MMQFATRTGDGRTMVLLALTRADVDRMVGGEAIVANLAELKTPGVVVTLMFGETEDALLAEMQGTGIKLVPAEDRRGNPSGEGDRQGSDEHVDKSVPG
jgi:hypothetical protein